jgi:hypothetical protein
MKKSIISFYDLDENDHLRKTDSFIHNHSFSLNQKQIGEENKRYHQKEEESSTKETDFSLSISRKQNRRSNVNQTRISPYFTKQHQQRLINIDNPNRTIRQLKKKSLKCKVTEQLEQINLCKN